ncbi:DUF305 domain-containing protein [Candidatus Raskinella chloraquaticus]
MRNSIVFFAAAVALIATPTSAQNTGMKDMAVDMSVLPQACQAALKDMKMSQIMGAMEMSKITGATGMPGADQAAMTEAQKASMQAMMKMQMPMMMTHVIKDADLAFNCGMIVHHQGAIDMANVEIKFGKDPMSKAMAERIIKDQKAEIVEMTARVEKMKAN